MRRFIKSITFASIAFFVFNPAFAQAPAKIDVANFAGSTFSDWFEATEHFEVSEETLANILGFDSIVEAYTQYSYYHVTCYTVHLVSFGTAEDLGVDIEEGIAHGRALMNEWVGFIPECEPDTFDDIELAIFGEFWTVGETPSVPWHFRARGVIFYPPGFPNPFIDVFEEEWLGYDEQGELPDLMLGLTEASIDMLTDDIYYVLND